MNIVWEEKDIVPGLAVKSLSTGAIYMYCQVVDNTGGSGRFVGVSLDRGVAYELQDNTAKGIAEHLNKTQQFAPFNLKLD